VACSIARTLDVIGEPWSPLILRDVWVGMNRFDEIQADLGISRKVLTERLNHLVEHGVLERRPYDRRPRYEHHLTAKGTELSTCFRARQRCGRGQGDALPAALTRGVQARDRPHRTSDGPPAALPTSMPASVSRLSAGAQITVNTRVAKA
jgi:DNA-binding HxlR family transcriptional regulator